MPNQLTTEQHEDLFMEVWKEKYPELYDNLYEVSETIDEMIDFLYVQTGMRGKEGGTKYQVPMHKSPYWTIMNEVEERAKDKGFEV